MAFPLDLFVKQGRSPLNDRTRRLLMAIRQSLIIAIGAIEDYLELARSIVPRRKREQG